MSTLDTSEPVEELAASTPSPGRRSLLRRALRSKQAIITATIIAAYIVLGLLANVIPEHTFWEARLDSLNLPFGSDTYPLGTDQFGRDILARLLHSINTAFVSALIGVSIALLLGVTFGLIGGYFDRVRSVTEWTFTLIMTFPGILLLILLMPITKGDYRFTMAIFGVLLSPGIYRIVRNQTIAVSRELYVDAARVSGLTNVRILARHVLSVVRGPVVVATAFLAGSAINVQSGLAFLGVGSKVIPSFGSMIGDGFRNLYVDPWQYVWPALALGVLNASFVLFGNALRDVLQGKPPKPAKQDVQALAAGFTASDIAPEAGALLQVRDLGIGYEGTDGTVREVVRGVSLSIRDGETVGLVGESGSGKTQTAFGILGVLPTEALITRGSILLDGKEILGASEGTLKKLRGGTIAYIPQEPMSNLDPVYTVGAQLVEGIVVSSGKSRAAAREHALSLLDRVGIPDAKRVFRSYPHEISGGMAQRVLIAGAIASRPRVLIADEPTTALDVTVQAEILDLLRDLQAEFGMSIILVTHNFGVVADICERLAVMQQGEIVETGSTTEVFADPQHPYTQMLLGSILDETTVRTDPPKAHAAGHSQEV